MSPARAAAALAAGLGHGHPDEHRHQHRRQAATAAAIKLWQPPVLRGLVIATSGRFSADAVAWSEQHNNDGAAPLIELWPESKLETLLAQKPYLAAAHGLR